MFVFLLPVELPYSYHMLPWTAYGQQFSFSILFPGPEQSILSVVNAHEASKTKACCSRPNVYFQNILGYIGKQDGNNEYSLFGIICLQQISCRSPVFCLWSGFVPGLHPPKLAQPTNVCNCAHGLPGQYGHTERWQEESWPSKTVLCGDCCYALCANSRCGFGPHWAQHV